MFRLCTRRFHFIKPEPESLYVLCVRVFISLRAHKTRVEVTLDRHRLNNESKSKHHHFLSYQAYLVVSEHTRFSVKGNSSWQPSFLNGITYLHEVLSEVLHSLARRRTPYRIVLPRVSWLTHRQTRHWTRSLTSVSRTGKEWETSLGWWSMVHISH